MFLHVTENRANEVRPNPARIAAFDRSFLEVRMFNVGHGEAILVIFDDGRTWLIDGGNTNGNTKNDKLAELLVDYLESYGLVLEAIVASHPHVDHVGATAKILESNSPNINYPVTLYRTDDASWEADNPQKKWLIKFWAAVQGKITDVALRNARREIQVSDGVTAILFAGSGDGPYTSIFLQLRYHSAKFLFTGDTHCKYEVKLLNTFGEADFRADVYKITHHGSSSGTAKTAVNASKPGIAIASTGDDSGHTLEKDTLKRLGGRSVRAKPKPRRVLETLVDGDIALYTDGAPYGDGVLYWVEFESPGEFAVEMGADILTLTQANRLRTESKHVACN